MKVQTEENFQKTIMDEVKNFLKSSSGTRIACFSFCMLLNCLYYKRDGQKVPTNLLLRQWLLER